MASRCGANRCRCCRSPSGTFCSSQGIRRRKRMNYLIWQLADSGFPAGGFAHSGGLEASVHHGLVTGGDTLRAFARQTMAQAGHGALPLVTAAHGSPEDLADLDQLSDAFLSSAV